MSDEELQKRLARNQGRRLWDHHGSWLLLAIIGIACFMAGSQYTAMSANETLRLVVESHERQDAKRVDRIRELLAENSLLTRQIVPKVSEASEKASEAAAKAAQAVEKATASP